MPIIRRNNATIHATDISREILAAIKPLYPLDKSIVGVRCIHCCEPSSEPAYLCLLHEAAILTVWTPEPLTLEDAMREAATCLICNAYLAIPPGMPEWDILRDKLCNGDYSQVEIFTGVITSTPTHALFNYKRLLPGASQPEMISDSGDYSAKHIAEWRAEIWPNALWVDTNVFDSEVEKRSR